MALAVAVAVAVEVAVAESLLGSPPSWAKATLTGPGQELSVAVRTSLKTPSCCAVHLTESCVVAVLLYQNLPDADSFSYLKYRVMCGRHEISWTQSAPEVRTCADAAYEFVYFKETLHNICIGKGL